MKIDPRKVTLTEADIEQYLWENPRSVKFEGGVIDHWLKRQYTVPSGIIDLVGQTTSGNYAVIEIKNVEIEAKAIAQVCRYAYDFDAIIMKLQDATQVVYPAHCLKVLVGPGVSTTVLRECEACYVEYVQFDVELTLHTSRRSWTLEFEEQREETYTRLADDDDLMAAHAFYAQKRDEFDAWIAGARKDDSASDLPDPGTDQVDDEENPDEDIEF